MKRQNFLRAQSACEKVLRWRKKLSPEAYLQCKRGGDLLLLHGMLYPDFSTHPKEVRKRVLVAGLVANLVRDKMTDARCIDATDAAIAFGKGEIGIDSLNKAANAAYAATHYTVKSTKADNAACAAAHAAAYATQASNVVDCVAYVTYPNDVNYAAYADAIYAKSAAIFRDIISFEEMIKK